MFVVRRIGGNTTSLRGPFVVLYWIWLTSRLQQLAGWLVRNLADEPPIVRSSDLALTDDDCRCVVNDPGVARTWRNGVVTM